MAKQITTKQSLTVFWLQKEGQGGAAARYHEETKGFTLHALWREPPRDAVVSDLEEQIISLWPGGAVQTRSAPIFAEEYRDLCVDVRVLAWPSDEEWFPLIEEILKAFVEKGAVVAWIGAESSFAWPGLFDPAEMTQTVYAAYAPALGFMVHSSLNEALRFLDDSELRRLRGIVQESEPA